MRFDSAYFKYWFDGIVGTSEFIASPDAFRRAWLQRDTGITSIHYYDELIEQLLGDLRLEENAVRFSDVLKGLDVLDAVSAFTDAVLSVNQAVKQNTELQNQETLLASREWAKLQQAAMRVIESPAARAYRTGRSDIDIPGESGAQQNP
ncbi:MAG: hypothetical protein WB579_20390 [Bryobacteraceae bacterium]